MKDRKGTRITKMFGKEIKTPIDDTPPPEYEEDPNDPEKIRKIDRDSYVAWGDEPFKQTTYSQKSWERDQRRLAGLAYSKGRKAADIKKTTDAEEFWKIYQKEYRELKGKGYNKTDAYKVIRRSMEESGDWYARQGVPYPSDTTLKKWLK